MDERTLDALRAFGGVWGRVSGDGDAARPALCALIDASARLGELLRALAPRCPAFCQALNAMAAAESAAQRRLRAEHFLASGENYCPGGACALVRDPLCALREAHSLSERLASSLQEAANAAPCGQRGALDALAAGERRRCRGLRAMVLRAMGVNCT